MHGIVIAMLRRPPPEVFGADPALHMPIPLSATTPVFTTSPALLYLVLWQFSPV
jgi:hypothetical protein